MLAGGMIAVRALTVTILRRSGYLVTEELQEFRDVEGPDLQISWPRGPRAV